VIYFYSGIYFENQYNYNLKLKYDIYHINTMEGTANQINEIYNKLKELQILVNKFDDKLNKIKIPNLNKPSIENQKDLSIVKPFLKWLGGKTQIINTILEQNPKEINNYHEMFVGGGSVLLGNLSLLKNKKMSIKGNIYAYDINKGLINVYKQIQNNKDILHDLISKFIKEYDSCPIIKKSEVNRKPLNIKEALKSKENYYYWLRNNFNSLQKNTVEHAALFIVINKTTFRGMYREGPNGFNVPYGNYKTTPTMMTKKQISYFSSLLKNVIFTCCDFEEAFKNVKPGDYIYLDPPYAPEQKNSFVGYNADGFNITKHETLFNLIKSQKNVKFCMSNANVKLVSDSFSSYNIKSLQCKRSINSKKPQSTTTELIITNYI
jgi:DNA adenine methylase